MIHFVIGTRAQLFKMAPLMLECEKRKLDWRWIYVAQHKETIDQTLKVFGLPKADYTVVNWDTEASNLPRYIKWLTKVMLSVFKSKKILAGYTGKEHFVLTHGDTTTTVYGAIIGRIHRCRVMHIESGLRSFNLREPFPEEINRILTFWLSNIYAAPGKWALANLKKYSGIKFNTFENTQVDTIRFGLEHCEKAKIVLPNEKYVVASVHRYENIFKKERLERIIKIIERVTKKYTVVFVQHPATEEQLPKFGFLNRLKKNPHIVLMPRLEYMPFIKAIKHSEFVITDGGGNQEELYHMGKPTLILRKSTERQEGLGQTAVLSKLNDKIIGDFIDNYDRYKKPPTATKVSPTKIIVDKITEIAGAAKKSTY